MRDRDRQSDIWREGETDRDRQAKRYRVRNRQRQADREIWSETDRQTEM